MDAREYFRTKKNNLYEDTYQHELKKHHRKRFIFISVFAALLLIGIAAFWFMHKNKTFDNYEIISRQAREDSKATNYLEFQGNILKYSMDGISCMTKEYKQLWNCAYEIKNPVIDKCEEYAAICDEGGTKIYIFNKDGQQGEVDTKLPIKKISVSGIGTVAVLMEDETINYIDYYDREGNLLSENKAPIEKSGFPLDLDLSQDGYKMAVSYMLIESVSINTKLAFYNFDSVGENEIDHLVSATNYDGAIVPNIEFLNKNIAVAFGDDFFELYEGTQKPKSIFKKVFKTEIKSVFYNHSYVGVVVENGENAQPYKLQVYNLKGKMQFEQFFGMDYDDIVLGEEGIYLYSDTMCQIYNFNGKKIYEGGLESVVETLIPISKRKLLIVCNNEIINLRLK